MRKNVVTASSPGRGRTMLAVAVLASAQLLLVLDMTVVNVALPEIGASLELGRTSLTWVVTIYTTVFGGLVLAGGKAADMLGARRMFVVGLVLFVLASSISALAGDAATLLLGRGLQGVGAAVLSPAALAVLLATVPDASRGAALAVWGSLSAVGTALGVTVGGVITSTVGWQWIFAINVPIGVVVAALLPVVTPRIAPTPSGRPDLFGAALVTAGTALVVYALVNAGNTGWLAFSTLLPFAAGVAAWLAFVAVERRVAQPMLRTALLSERSILAGGLLMTVATGLMVGNFFLGSFALQRAYGEVPLRAGLGFLPVAGAVALGAHLAGCLLHRLSPRVVATSGLVLAALGEAIAAVLDGSPAALVAGLAVAALGIGAVFVTAFTSALANAGPQDGGLRSAIVNTAHELGGAFGIAVLSTIAAGALRAARPLPESFSPAFGVAGLIAAAAAVLAAVLVPTSNRPAGDRHLQGVRS